MDFTTELLEADESLSNYISAVAQHFRELGFAPDRRSHNVTHSMSLAIAVVAQTFLACGGNIDKGEEVGEMVKQGIITTMAAYRDAMRVTHPGSHRRN